MKVYGVYYTFWDDCDLVKLFSTYEKAVEYTRSSDRRDERGRDICERYSVRELEVE